MFRKKVCGKCRGKSADELIGKSYTSVLCLSLDNLANAITVEHIDPKIRQVLLKWQKTRRTGLGSRVTNHNGMIELLDRHGLQLPPADIRLYRAVSHGAVFFDCEFVSRGFNGAYEIAMLDIEGDVIMNLLCRLYRLR